MSYATTLCSQPANNSLTEPASEMPINNISLEPAVKFPWQAYSYYDDVIRVTVDFKLYIAKISTFRLKTLQQIIPFCKPTNICSSC